MRLPKFLCERDDLFVIRWNAEWQFLHRMYKIWDVTAAERTQVENDFLELSLDLDHPDGVAFGLINGMHPFVSRAPYQMSRSDYTLYP